MTLRELGLATDAGEREVRRAYARLLKLNRPDDDAVAFQDLHEAYERALAQVRRRAIEGEEEEDSREVEGSCGRVADEAQAAYSEGDLALPDEWPGAATGGVDDAPQPHFEYGTFVSELLQRARTSASHDLAAWLTSHPALFSLALKASLTAPVLQTIAAQEPPLPPAAIDRIAGFFVVDSPARSDAWLRDLVEEARARATAAQMFDDRRLPPSSARPGGETVWFDGVIDDEIVSPRWPGKTPALMLIPGVPTRMAHRISEVVALTRGAAGEFIHARRRRFLDRLTDRGHLGLDRIGLTLLRAMLFGGLFVGVVTAFTGKFDTAPAAAVAIATGLLLLWQVSIAGWVRLQLAADGRGRSGVLRSGTVLALVGGAALMGALRDSPGVAPYSFAIGALLYAAGRVRIGRALGLGLLVALADLMVLVAASPLRPLPPGLGGLCVAALAVLATDAWVARREQVPLEAVWSDSGAIHRLTLAACGLVLVAVFLRNILR